MTYPSRRQYKYAKKPYRVRNWASNERGLVQRGDLTVWFSDDAIKAWREPPRGRPGGQRVYARTAIETALTVRWFSVWHCDKPRDCCARCVSSSSWTSRPPTTRR